MLKGLISIHRHKYGAIPMVFTEFFQSKSPMGNDHVMEADVMDEDYNLLFSYDVSTASVSDARPLVGNDLGSDVEGVGEAPVEPRPSPRLGKNTRLCQKRNQLAQPPTGCLVALTCQVDQSQKEA